MGQVGPGTLTTMLTTEKRHDLEWLGLFTTRMKWPSEAWASLARPVSYMIKWGLHSIRLSVTKGYTRLLLHNHFPVIAKDVRLRRQPGDEGTVGGLHYNEREKFT